MKDDGINETDALRHLIGIDKGEPVWDGFLDEFPDFGQTDGTWNSKAYDEASLRPIEELFAEEEALFKFLSDDNYMPKLTLEETLEQGIIQQVLADPGRRHLCPAVYGMDFVLTAGMVHELIDYKKHPKINAWVVQARKATT